MRSERQAWLSRCAGIFFLLAGIASAQNPPRTMLGYRDFAPEWKLDQQFLAVPSAALAGEELKALTAAPHVAGSKEDFATAQYVARKFREAGLETRIVPYRVWMNLPRKVQVTAFDADGAPILAGPTPERVSEDEYQDDRRILPAFSGYSPSGDVTAEAVYANYGRRKDFDWLAAHHIDLHGKIVIVRYGEVYRGVKVYLAAQHGAAAVLIYSDPADDGETRGAVYPYGPWRPESGVQRGSILYLFEYPGDPTTPDVASVPRLSPAKRIALAGAASLPGIPAMPLSAADAAPILRALEGPAVPQRWQGGLPFPYHLGPGPVKVHILLRQNYAYRTIWNVIGRIPGTEYPGDWVITGNHRDAWVFGAADPGSGTAALLEAVHGVGALLRQGWRPKRTMLFASWDGEELGLTGSTEWAEQHADQLAHAAAYFNTDIAVTGPNFEAAAVPSLKPFVAAIAKEVESPQGGTVFDAWQREQEQADPQPAVRPANAAREAIGVRIQNLGSGSDYTPFLQHLGVPSTDIGSMGPYGVYHSAFDNYTWFTKFADPTFVYLEQQARVLGLEAITMADADLTPYNYAVYGDAVLRYLEAASIRAAKAGIELDFANATRAAERFRDAGARALLAEQTPAGALDRQNQLLRQAEEDLLSAPGLPNRPWYRHTVFAPGIYTGYAPVVLPGVNEAIDDRDAPRATAELLALTDALNRAAATLRKMP